MAKKKCGEPQCADAEVADLIERAEIIRRTSDTLIKQMKQLASEIAQRNATAADAGRDRKR